MPMIPAPEDVLTIAPPPCLRISGISCFMHRNTLRRLVSMIRSHSSSSYSAVGAAFLGSMPALLNAKSSRPKASTVLSRAAFTSAARVTSHRTATARPPCSSIMRAVSWLPCSDMSAATTLAPSRANASAAARPMPLAAPVTNATFPPKLPFWFLAISCSFPSSLLPRDRATRCVMAGSRANSLVVLLVADLLHPVHRLAVERLLDGDVGHGRGRRGAVPVLLARREPDHVAGPNLLDRASPALRQAAAGRHDESLPERVRVPGGAGAGLEGDAGSGRAGRGVGREQRVDAHRAREPLGRSLVGRLCTNSLDVHAELLSLGRRELSSRAASRRDGLDLNRPFRPEFAYPPEPRRRLLPFDEGIVSQVPAGPVA